MMKGCELRGYPHNCGGAKLEWHHILNHSKARGNKKVQKILRSNPPELIAKVCSNANIARVADEKGAQAVLFQRKVDEFGYEHMKDYLDNLPWKIPRPELRLEALLDE